jgi:hypothetical protein
MTDVFISYAKTDRPLASKLVTLLEAEGWTVWWDKALSAADLYRDEIMKQLASARAVITIWTPNSIRSDWVRAEAGTAKKEGKLIPVKTPDVTYAEIPLPFGEMHTESLGSSELIRAAIVAQLAKPTVEPSAAALLAKGFKYEVLTWFGIVGGALTLFTNLGAVLKLADWARVLVQHWKEWTHTFWLWAFGWLGIHLPPEWTPVLSFVLFGSLVAIGQVVKFKSMIKHQATKDKYESKSFHLISWRTLLSVLGMFAMFTLVLLISWMSDYWREDWSLYTGTPPITDFDHAVEGIAFTISPTVLFARHRLHAAISTGLMLVFFIIISFLPLRELGAMAIQDMSFHMSIFVPVIAFGLICILPLFLLAVAPAKAVSRRLIFLALGLLLLIALNELSKLGLDVIAPKLQG